jgi:hypothetical protein
MGADTVITIEQDETKSRSINISFYTNIKAKIVIPRYFQSIVRVMIKVVMFKVESGLTGHCMRQCPLQNVIRRWKLHRAISCPTLPSHETTRPHNYFEISKHNGYLRPLSE